MNNLDIFESISDQITLIEWPEIIKNYKLVNKIELFFEYDKDYNNRFINISSKSNTSFLNEFE